MNVIFCLYYDYPCACGSGQ